jgi:hypothetical protein
MLCLMQTDSSSSSSSRMYTQPGTSTARHRGDNSSFQQNTPSAAGGADQEQIKQQ